MHPLFCLSISNCFGCSNAVTPKNCYCGVRIINILHCSWNIISTCMFRHTIFIGVVRTRTFLCTPPFRHCSAGFQAKLFASNDAADIAAGLTTRNDFRYAAQCCFLRISPFNRLWSRLRSWRGPGYSRSRLCLCGGFYVLLFWSEQVYEWCDSSLRVLASSLGLYVLRCGGLCWLWTDNIGRNVTALKECVQGLFGKTFGTLWNCILILRESLGAHHQLIQNICHRSRWDFLTCRSDNGDIESSGLQVQANISFALLPKDDIECALLGDLWGLGSDIMTNESLLSRLALRGKKPVWFDTHIICLGNVSDWPLNETTDLFKCGRDIEPKCSEKFKNPVTQPHCPRGLFLFRPVSHIRQLTKKFMEEIIHFHHLFNAFPFQCTEVLRSIFIIDIISYGIVISLSENKTVFTDRPLSNKLLYERLPEIVPRLLSGMFCNKRL